MSGPNRPGTAAGDRRPRQRRIGIADGLFAAALVMIASLWWFTRRDQPPMPDKVVDAAERQLYLQPGGLYTAEDIEANGRRTASQKFIGFRAQHDFNPQPGDQICPITQTKANGSCDWVIGGRRYTFCCPPCIDEFVALAKRAPDQIRAPEAYVK